MRQVFIKESSDLGLFEVLFFIFFFSWKEKETKVQGDSMRNSRSGGTTTENKQ
jgi:hypothetical protein